MKLLFISRSYPPLVGGLEKHNQAIYCAVKKKIGANTLVNKRGKWALPWFLSLCFMRALLVSSRRESVLLGDGVLSIVGWFIKCIRPSVAVVCVVHGLDVTYKNAFYQTLWLGFFIPKVDKIIAVSQATANALISRGISKAKVLVIPNGIEPLPAYQRESEFLASHFNIDSKGKVVLFTLGHLVKRKGVDWFINNVLTQLGPEFIYIVAGDGPERMVIKQSIIDKQLSNKVFVLGGVSESIKTQLFANADLFIQPNIKVSGDMEGFGIVVLEANIHGLAVLGADLEGLKDSICDGNNGWLVASGQAQQFIKRIAEVTASKACLNRAGDKAKVFCLQSFCWNNIADQYINVFSELRNPH